MSLQHPIDKNMARRSVLSAKCFQTSKWQKTDACLIDYCHLLMQFHKVFELAGSKYAVFITKNKHSLWREACRHAQSLTPVSCKFVLSMLAAALFLIEVATTFTVILHCHHLCAVLKRINICCALSIFRTLNFVLYCIQKTTDYCLPSILVPTVGTLRFKKKAVSCTYRIPGNHRLLSLEYIGAHCLMLG